VPFFEEAFNELIAAIGPENILTGFDFPHPEGLADPRSFFEDQSDQPAEVVRRIMSDNMRDLLNL
jgi:predicted TIM-barrel fold metal-dependent hydrolase